ncbi:MAG: ABC transporter permease [Sphingobacteriales bacterium]|nr:ABC transporter permease [Sphingobacteriales bacterium]MBI3717177.1 ABC transporter permease [Sphingobacteriales bacterium]
MIKHYFKIAIRSIARQKILSGINVLGLSIGIACFSLFLLFAVNEFNFDRFHKDAKNIYQVYLWNDAYGDNEAEGRIHHPMPLAAAMKQDFPEVMDYTRFRNAWSENFVRIASNDVRRVKISYADPHFFNIFSFKLKYGNAATALNDLYSLVITKTKANELFGSDNVIGRTVQVKMEEEFIPFTITAVTENIPSNSSINFDVLGNFEYLEKVSERKSALNWHRFGFLTYVKLQQGSGLPNDAAKLSNFFAKHHPDQVTELKKSGVNWKNGVFVYRYGLLPIEKVHTNTFTQGGPVPNIDPKIIWILLSIAAGVLLIACINFTTLSIGRSAGRAKEIGVRKVMGSERRQLVAQFIAEALVMSLLSSIISVLLMQLILPWFNQLSGRDLHFSVAQFPELIWMLAGLVLLVGILAGAYPAMVLSGFRPIEVLKSKIRVGGSNFFTKSLVTVQFSLSVILIICTIIIMQQKQYMTDKNPGYNKENILVVDAEETKSKQIFPLFKQALEQRSDIEGITSAELSFSGNMGWSQSGFDYNGKHKSVFEYFVDNNFINVLGMQMVTGRQFDPTIASDTIKSVVINETMMKEFGWTMQNVIGQKLTGYYDDSSMFAKTPEVIGVVRDFNFMSMKEKISPQMFHQFASYAPFKFFVRLKPGNPSSAIAGIQKTWSSLVPSLPLKYSFMDEDLTLFYKDEQKMNSIIAFAGGISIFLACLGLFGLAALAAVNKTKEIGIRKILGASVSGIIGLLSKDFLKLVVIAFVIAAPLAWFVMHQWLQDYAYRINISWWVFVAAGASALAIALFTISMQAIKAAVTNPVKSLRTE